MRPEKFLIILVGPTAVGKTALCVELAHLLHTEIISADSRQFFREMSIGSAKPTIAEMKGITHHFIDSHSIHEPYNVAQFEAEVIPRIERLFETNDLLLLTGGSGLYIDAICKGMDELPMADETVRQKIQLLLDEEGITGLQQLLKKLDPEYYHQVDLHNPQRLGRALEVCLVSGEPYSALRKGKQKQRNFHILKIGIDRPRPELYERINQRVDQMMKDGLLEEARRLFPYKHVNALQTVGYKELFDHLEGRLELTDAVELIKQHTRNFAKRQLTWFRRDPEITWFQPDQHQEILSFILQSKNKIC